MEVDESFAEYVSARWSMLYRLAVLLGGADRAEDLTVAALVRAYRDWREIDESPSPDDRVKELLARAAVEAPSAPSPQHTGLDALPGLQRAVVVLRGFELLSDREIARIVRCRADDVEAEAAAALARLDCSAAEVTAEMTGLVDEIDVPPPLIDALLARGREARRQRLRRSVAWAAAVSVVLLAGIGLGSLLEDPETAKRPPRPPPTSLVIPERLADLPAGAEPKLPYVERSALHVDDHWITGLRSMPTSVTATPGRIFVAYVDGVIERVSPMGAVDTFVVDSQGDLVVDPANRLAAWLERGAGPPRVHLRSIDADDPPRDEVRTIEGAPACCEGRYHLVGITRAGEVVVSLPDGDGAWVWDTRLGDVTKVSGIGNGTIVQVAGDEVVVHHPPSYFAIGELRDGSLLVDQELAAEQVDFADPLGKRLVYVEDAEVHVRLLEQYGRSHSLRDVRLGLPRLYVPYVSVRWEDSGHVLLDVADASMPDGALVRCEVQSGACEIAARFDDPHLLAR